MPDQFRKALNTTQKSNPAFRQIVFGEDEAQDFIKTHYSPRILRAFTALDPRYGAARADLLRYLILYVNGGVYLDAKSSAVRLNEIRNTDKLLTSYWPLTSIDNWGTVFLRGFPWKGELQQYWIATPPRNPALRSVIQQCVWQIEAAMADRRRGSHGKWSVWMLTGPMMFTYALQTHTQSISIRDPNCDSRMTYMHVNHHRVLKKDHYFNHSHNVIRKHAERHKNVRSSEKQ